MSSLEAKVISAVIHNNDPFQIMGEPKELFQSHGDVFEFLKTYYMKHHEAPSRATIKEEFKDVELPSADAPTAHYLGQLKSQFVRVNTERVIQNIADRLDQGKAPSEVLESGLSAFTKLTRYTSSTIDLNITDHQSALEYYIKEKEMAGDEGVVGIPTGIDSIDANYPTGLAPGQSIVVMGFSGGGKSYFTGLLAVRAWLKGRRVMVVSLEMTPEEYRNRVYAMMSSGAFRSSDLARGDINEDDFTTWAKSNLEKSSDFIVVSTDGMSEMTPNKVQAKIDIHRPDLVIYDYAQLGSDNDHTEAMTPRMLALSRQMKLLAMANRIPIILITAVTDEEGSKRDGPPRVNQVAWSKGIEYDASLILSVHRHKGTNIVEIACRKNRYGDEFSFYFEVDFDSGIWKELFDTPEGLKAE